MQSKSNMDAYNDEPGESIHWELICSCDEIGFTPTPESTPSPEITPTPTLKKYIETPTPTPIFRCEDHYEEWSEDKILLQGEPHYRFKERVYYKGKVLK